MVKARNFFTVVGHVNY